MSNAARNHKDNVFCLIYRERKNLLSLYNAMNGTSYGKEDELEIVTLEGAICMKMKNDATFIIGSELNLYEQQSTVNPNMPLRNLYYVAEELKKIAPVSSLYHTTRASIPAPRFVVFYNGTREQPERQVYSLSDLFSRKESVPELELKVTVLNINEGYNKELLSGCESLDGYMRFVKKVRVKRGIGIKTEEAVRTAVEECISENILAGFFADHREEIIEMGIFEFDQELHDKALLEDGIMVGKEEGRKEGIDLSVRIIREIQKGNMDDDAIALLCGCSGEMVKIIREACN